MTQRFLLSLALVAVAAASQAQSKTTGLLQEKYSDAFSLFFYNNTLRMINLSEDKAFDELIEDIEKMKVLIVKKATAAIDYKKVVGDYKKESFEEIVTSRHEGKNFDVFIKEEGGETKGMLVLVNDVENLFVLDIVGKVALDKITSLYNQLESNNEVAKKIQGFLTEGESGDKEHHAHD